MRIKGTCIGFTHVVGDYEGKPYDNYNLHFTHQGSAETVGKSCITLKLRSSQIAEAFEDSGMKSPCKSADDLSQLVGKRWKVYADNYRVVEEIFVCE